MYLCIFISIDPSAFWLYMYSLGTLVNADDVPFGLTSGVMKTIGSLYSRDYDTNHTHTHTLTCN